MANNDDNWRTRLDHKRDEERKRIDDALNTDTAFWIIVGIVVVSAVWALVTTFTG